MTCTDRYFKLKVYAVDGGLAVDTLHHIHGAHSYIHTFSLPRLLNDLFVVLRLPLLITIAAV